MKNIKYLAILFIASLVFVSTAQSAIIMSDFNTDQEGWTGSGVEISYFATGGNPGGYLQVNDLPYTSFVRAPTKFLGDLSSFDGGTLSFDMKLFSSDLPLSKGGKVKLRSNSITLKKNVIDVTSLSVPSDWVTGSISFTAATWGLEQSTWITFISNITSIDVVVDPSAGANNRDIAGFDNFKIQSVPIPSAIWLFGSGLLGLLGIARHKSFT